MESDEKKIGPVYVIKYTATSGRIARYEQVLDAGDGYIQIGKPGTASSQLIRKGEWFLSEKEAQRQAAVLIQRKIATHERAIARLRAMQPKTEGFA